MWIKHLLELQQKDFQDKLQWAHNGEIIRIFWTVIIDDIDFQYWTKTSWYYSDHLGILFIVFCIVAEINTDCGDLNSQWQCPIFW